MATTDTSGESPPERTSRAADTDAGATRPSLDQVRCVVGCALALGVSVAPAFIATIAVLSRPMAEDLKWSRGSVLVAVTIFSAGAVLLTPVAGLLLDRFGARVIALVGVIGLPCAVAAEGLIPPDYGAFVALAVAVSLVGAAAQPTVYMAVIVRWFDRRLGLAIAISLAGLGLGQTIFNLVTEYFVQNFGWRGAWIAIGAVVLIGGLASYAIIPWRRTPRVERAEAGQARRPNVWPVLVRAPLFWVMAVALLFGLLVTGGVQLNIVAALSDQGLGGYAAASVLATIAFTAILGRLLTGVLIDRYSYIVIGAILFVGQAIGCLLLAGASSLGLAYAGAAMIGLTYGAESDILPYAIKRRFGVTFFGSIYGLMFGIVQIGVMVGPLLGALSFDRLGSYRPAFTLFAVASVCACTLWILSRRLTAPELPSV